MTLVVDANVAVKWFIQQQGSDHARRVQNHRGALIAPAMLIAETTNDFWRHVVLVTADKRLINRLASTKYRSQVIHLPDWT